MSRPDFQSVRLEGNFFSRDFLTRLGAPNSDLTHLAPSSYGLLEGSKLRERIAQSWNTLSARYVRFSDELQSLPPGSAATAHTQNKWLLPLLEELGFGRVQSTTALEVGERSYPISHLWSQTPIHLLGARVPLDKRSPGVPGAAQSAPHALVQELLNRSDDHLWAILSNGRQLRLLRDSANIARQSYVEFNLEAIFQNDDAPAFAQLWLLAHASRFENNGAILEEWQKLARVEGERALETLRVGVERAISTLAEGFLAHPANTNLRLQLREGQLSSPDFYRETLRLVYRMLFVLVAETKDALLLPALDDEERAADPTAALQRDEARARYAEYFSLSRLKTKAGRRKGDAHFDLWRGLRLSFSLLRDGDERLALPALGGFLFEPLRFDECEISNCDLLQALRELAWFESNGVRREVNFNLGSEELGSVYESLLELSPALDLDNRRFELQTLAGNERKTTGSYYTPEILVKSLLESALEPVLARALGQARENAKREIEDKGDSATPYLALAETALLDLSILDPACGSGHFLTAAARRVARELAFVRSEGDEPSLKTYRAALRDVVSHCIYGIDINPMAVELCKVALWMEALEPGKPLSFLDAHIRCGNALLGATPELLEEGIPDSAFAPLEGDDKAVVASLKKRNKSEHQGNLNLFDDEYLPLGDLGSAYEKIEQTPDGDIQSVRRKAEEFEKWQQSAPYRNTHLLADAWCAAFVWRRIKDSEPEALEPITQDDFEHIRRHARCKFPEQEPEIKRLAQVYNWFHPHLEFPRIWKRGGFDLVIGNPPWERVKLQEKEWFAVRSPEIANAPNAARRKALIDALADNDRPLWLAFQEARRRAEGESHFARSSNRYPLCGVGDVNTYALFAEANRNFIGSHGRVGCILPSGIATDDTTKNFFASICDTHQLASFFDIENREKVFPAVDSRFKFCLLTLAGTKTPVKEAQFVFFAHTEADLTDSEKRFSLSAQDIALLNPNTKTCPIFRTTYDAELTKSIYRRVPVLMDESKGEKGNLWGIRFSTMFHMSNDSGLFRTHEEMEAAGCELEGNVWTGELGDESGAFLPLYEAKMLHHFNHRWATYNEMGETQDLTDEERANPHFVVIPRYWVNEKFVTIVVSSNWKNRWLVGFRDICRSTDERTVITSILPNVGVGNNAPLLFSTQKPLIVACFYANLTSLILDWVARFKVGGTHLNFFIAKQLPVLPPSTYDQTPTWTNGVVLRDWISKRVVELCYTAYDLRDFARDCGYEGEPFAWDVERRFQLRCELDAAFFHLYGLSYDEAAYVLETFPIVRRKDEAEHGTYRTKERILEIYQRFAE